jgi:hypothetical protein
MRFADADVLAQSEGTTIPPLEVRMALQPGDRVGLYEEVRHHSMGAGLSPLEVLVLGSPEPGWFIGETEDGREISFHAGNVADVLHGSPSMGGIFDWVMKKITPPPLPGEMIQVPPPPVPQLPVVAPPPRAEERRGLIAQVKSLFMAPFAARPEAQAPARSIFDVFKKPEVPTGLPAERGPGTIAPREERPSVISVFKPQEKRVIPIVEQITAPAVYLAPGEKTIIPFVESMLAPAVVLPKSAELEPFMVREQKQKELWSKVIAEAAPEAPTPIEKVVEIFTPAEVQPQEEVIPPNLPEKLHRTLKVLPMPRRGELLPSVEDVARGLATFYQPIEELWAMLRRARQSPEWQESINQTGFAKEEFETLGTCGGQPSIYEEIASYFHIPWQEIRGRAVVREAGDYEQWVKTDRIWMDIIAPLADRMTEAFSLMKPADLPGQIVLERADPHGGHDDPCIMTVAYIEGEPREDAPPGYGGVPAEEEEEEPQLRPGQKFTVDEAQEAIERLEQESIFFVQEREKLDRSDPEYRLKLAYIENEIKGRRTMLKDLSSVLEAMEHPEREYTIAQAEAEIERLEKDLAFLAQEREKVSRDDPEYRSKLAAIDKEIKERKDYLTSLEFVRSQMEMQEQEEEEPAKRAPAKKKPSKRGKKKGK